MDDSAAKGNLGFSGPPALRRPSFRGPVGRSDPPGTCSACSWPPRRAGREGARENSSSEQSFDVSVRVKIYRLRRWLRGKARHRHDSPADRDDEARDRRKADLVDRNRVAGWRAAQIGVGGEGILRLRHADRQLDKALIFPLFQLVTDPLVPQHLVGPEDRGGYALDFVEQRKIVGVEGRELRGSRNGDFGHAPGQVQGAFGPSAQCLQSIASEPWPTTYSFTVSPPPRRRRRSG